MDLLTLWQNTAVGAREAYAFVVIVVGGATAFFGYRIFRFLVMLVGFTVGLGFGMIAGALMGRGSPQSALTAGLLVGLVFGLVLGWVFWKLYWVTVFVYGGLVFSGLTAVLWLLGTRGNMSGGVLALMAVAFVVGGIVAVSVNRAFIIIGSAFNGAYSVAAGAYLMLQAKNPQPFVLRLLQGNTYGFNPGIALLVAGALIVLLLTLAGSVYQFRTTGPRQERIEPAYADWSE